MADDQTPVAGDLRDQIARTIHMGDGTALFPFEESGPWYRTTADAVVTEHVAPLLAESAERQAAMVRDLHSVLDVEDPERYTPTWSALIARTRELVEGGITLAAERDDANARHERAHHLLQQWRDAAKTAEQERDKASAEALQLEEAGLAAAARADSYGAALAEVCEVVGLARDTVTDIRQVPAAVRAEVQRLRDQLAEALGVAERAARDTGQRHTLAAVEAELDASQE